MNCCDTDCEYRELNGEDNIFCNFIGIEVGRGQQECILDRFDREFNRELDIWGI